MPPDPLLLLPGTMCDGRVWAPQIEALREACAEARIGDLTRSSSIAGMAQQVLADAPLRFALGGLSMGGIVALEICRRAPERVTRLALLDTNTFADTAERQAARDRQIERARRGELEALMREEFKPRYLAAANRARPGLLDTVMAMARDLGPEVFIRQVTSLRDRPDSTASLGGIRCPTLVLCGAEDELCPPGHHREIAAAIPGARLSIVPRCGHLSTLEQPDVASDALREWLRWPGQIRAE